MIAAVGLQIGKRTDEQLQLAGHSDARGVRCRQQWRDALIVRCQTGALEDQLRRPQIAGRQRAAEQLNARYRQVQRGGLRRRLA